MTKTASDSDHLDRYRNVFGVHHHNLDRFEREIKQAAAEAIWDRLTTMKIPRRTGQQLVEGIEFLGQVNIEYDWDWIPKRITTTIKSGDEKSEVGVTLYHCGVRFSDGPTRRRFEVYSVRVD